MYVTGTPGMWVVDANYMHVHYSNVCIMVYVTNSKALPKIKDYIKFNYLACYLVSFSAIQPVAGG